MRRFRNRDAAARELAAALSGRGYVRPIILGIPRGGVPLAARIAREMGGEFGVVVARKLRAPMQPELAIGAVAADGSTFINEPLLREAGVDPEYLAREMEYQLRDARAREARFDGSRHSALRGRTVIVVDDGIATGATAIASLRSVRAAGASLVVLAVPVGPPDTLKAMANEADEVICPHAEPDFYAVGQFYDDFAPVTDDEVAAIIAAWHGPGDGATRRSVFVERDGVRLATRLAAPATGGPAPCVVFVHGLGSGKDSPRNVTIAEHLLDAGFATILFDLNGHGESSEDPRSIDAFVDDTVAVMAWACQQPEVDATRLALAGSSLGAVTALEAAKIGLVRPRTLVLRAPPVSEEDLEGLNVPALALMGTHDPLLPQVRMACAHAPLVTLRVVDGAGHLFEEPGTLEKAVEATVGWLSEQLLPVHAEAL